MSNLIENFIFAVGGIMVAAISYFLKETLADNKAKAAAQEKIIEDLKSHIQNITIQIVNTNGVTKESFANLDRRWMEIYLKSDSKIDMLAQLVNQYHKDTAKLEGRLEEHMLLLSSQISTNRNLSDKLTRIFEYMDAKERASDSAVKAAGSPPSV